MVYGKENLNMYFQDTDTYLQTLYYGILNKEIQYKLDVPKGLMFDSET